jgi:hypothetical protein
LVAVVADGAFGGEEDVVDPVVVAMAEAGFADPHAGHELVELDAGFLRDLTSSRLFEGFTPVDPAAGQLPPVMARVVRVAGVMSSTRAPIRGESTCVVGDIQPVPPESLAAACRGGRRPGDG